MFKTLLALLLCLLLALPCAVAETAYMPGETTTAIFSDVWNSGKMINSDLSLAMEMDADVLMILTEVPAVAIGFGTPHQKDLHQVTPEQLEEYARQGEFGAGSMLPKVQAAVEFVRSAPNRTALITSLDQGLEALSGGVGTQVRQAGGHGG